MCTEKVGFTALIFVYNIVIQLKLQYIVIILYISTYQAVRYMYIICMLLYVSIYCSMDSYTNRDNYVKYISTYQAVRFMYIICMLLYVSIYCLHNY